MARWEEMTMEERRGQLSVCRNEAQKKRECPVLELKYLQFNNKVIAANLLLRHARARAKNRGWLLVQVEALQPSVRRLSVRYMTAGR